MSEKTERPGIRAFEFIPECFSDFVAGLLHTGIVFEAEHIVIKSTCKSMKGSLRHIQKFSADKPELLFAAPLFRPETRFTSATEP